MPAEHAAVRKDLSPRLEAFCDSLASAGVRVVASLPDDWVIPMIDAVAADERFVHVRVAREAEAVGVCAGAFFGGVNSVAIMGMAGVLAVVHELATLNLMHGIPLVIISSLRGQPEEEPQTVYQVVQGQVGVPVIEALGIYHSTVRALDDLDIAALVKHSRITKRPVIATLTRAVVHELSEVENAGR
jgi:sulfopyruvate decarboxylase subunit alpha